MFCQGNTTCTAANSITLAANIANNSSTPTFTCSAGAAETFGTCGGAKSATANLFSFQTLLNSSTIYSVNAFSLTNVSPGFNVPTTSTLNYFSDTFGEMEETPEPSTFGLLSLALAALSFFAVRRRATNDRGENPR